MKNESISVIVPVYKVEKYIRKSIDSIINQTYKSIEIILVDDGSPDNCPQICDEYAKIDNRIKVIHQNNMGVAAARNRGIEIATGKYIGFVDSDDYIENTMFEDLLKALITNNAQMSICNINVITDKENYIKNNYPDSKTYSRKEVLRELILDKNIQSYPCNKLYLKTLFDKIRYPIGRNYEDIGTTFYLAEKCDKVQLIGKVEYNYINRSDSIVFNIKSKTIIDYIDIIMDRYEYINKKYDDLKVYNFYYITKTLITAYNDIKKIESISENLKKSYEKIYLTVKENFKNYENQIIEFFNEKQVNSLYEILGNTL